MKDYSLGNKVYEIHFGKWQFEDVLFYVHHIYAPHMQHFKTPTPSEYSPFRRAIVRQLFFENPIYCTN